MNIKPFKFTFLLLVLFLTSCEVVKFVTVPVEYTPKHSLTPGSTILVVNQVDLSINTKYTKRRIDVMKVCVQEACRYARNQLAKLPNIKVAELSDTTDFKMNTDSIKTLALKYKANYVLVLKDFTADIDLDDIQGSSVFYSNKVNVDFVLYESNGIYFKKLNGAINEMQPEQPNMGILGNLIIHPTVGGNKSAMVAATERAAQVALQDYLPIIISHTRPLYNDEWLQPALTQIYARNFDAADSLLKPYLKVLNPQVVSKAAYVLAVVYEAEGDVGLAIDMAKLSLNKLQNNYAEAILAELKEE